jgi:hypothetical protein
MPRCPDGFGNAKAPEENKKSMFVSRENMVGEEPTSDKFWGSLALSRPSLDLGDRSSLCSGRFET